MSEGCVMRVEKLENGWEVELLDTAVQEKNRAPSKPGKFTPYEDPWKSYAFEDFDKMIKFIKEKLPILHPESDDDVYDSAFAEASKGS
jgi:hypothetical protein